MKFSKEKINGLLELNVELSKVQMTILHVSAVRGWGGGENHIESLCHELKASNPEITNIVLCVKGDLFNERLIKTDIITETSPLVTNLDLRFVFKIISLWLVV